MATTMKQKRAVRAKNSQTKSKTLLDVSHETTRASEATRARARKNKQGNMQKTARVERQKLAAARKRAGNNINRGTAR